MHSPRVRMLVSATLGARAGGSASLAGGRRPPPPPPPLASSPPELPACARRAPTPEVASAVREGDWQCVNEARRRPAAARRGPVPFPRRGSFRIEMLGADLHQELPSWGGPILEPP